MKRKQKYSLIHIENCQIKSTEKAVLLCSLIDQLEKEFGIKQVEISFKNNFICPDIDLTTLSNSEKPMEKLIGRLMIKLDKMKNGKKSLYNECK